MTLAQAAMVNASVADAVVGGPSDRMAKIYSTMNVETMCEAITLDLCPRA